jgi:hypothetical protein
MFTTLHSSILRFRSWLYVLVIMPLQMTSVKLKNPLKVQSLNDLLEAILQIFVVLATPLIVFFIIYAGFLYVTARGNPEQIKQATQALTYAVIGGVIILGAFAIATIVSNLVSAF